jgi:hypothetical protein
MNGLSAARPARLRKRRLLNREMDVVFRQPNILRVYSSRLPAIALLLLACLCWSEVVESAHHHYDSVTASPPLRGLSYWSSGASGLRVANATRNRTPIQRDCLLCQLHRSLFATALNHGLHQTPAALGALNRSVGFGFHESTSNSSQRGRAPPVFSLS